VLASASSLLIAAVLVVGAAAAPDPSRANGIPPILTAATRPVCGGGLAASYHVRYYDDGATVCAPDLSVAASAIGALGRSGDTISGLCCLLPGSPPYVYDLHSYFEYTLVGTTLVTSGHHLDPLSMV